VRGPIPWIGVAIVVVVLAGVVAKRIEPRKGVGGVVAAYVVLTLAGVVTGRTGSASISVAVKDQHPPYGQLESEAKSRGRTECNTPWLERAWLSAPNVVYVSFEHGSFPATILELGYDCRTGHVSQVDLNPDQAPLPGE
jgi:uncharacterized membrane protein YeaQ/YmgE (transglycosylase-associated protein family)